MSNASLQDLDANTLLLQAASADPRRATQLRVLAAQVFNARNDFSAALQALPMPVPVSLDTALRDSYLRTAATAWIGLGDAILAQQLQSQLTEPLYDDFVLNAQICALLSDFRCRAESLISASLAGSVAASQPAGDLNEEIWAALSQARRAPEQLAEPTRHAWWFLQQQVRNATTATAQKNAWLTWRQRFPSHPAAQHPPVALQQLTDYRRPNMGILLPITGTYGAAGVAVRDGLIAAYLTESPTNRPQIRIYDTGSAAMETLVRQAMNDGMDVLIGPLIKSEVEIFSQLTRGSRMPRLVLNYLDVHSQAALAKPRTDLSLPSAEPELQLFQFGIAIEDEALSLAEHVRARGVSKVLIVHNESNWALRAKEAFTTAWPYPVTEAPFSNIKELTGAVGGAMQVSASDARRRELANILGEALEFLPRARTDLDAVIALTTQVQAQALIPALKFHFANSLPVFATSQAAIGDHAQDLAGFEITEMTLFADPRPAHQRVRQIFDLHNDPLGELYALGFDAYQLGTWLPLMQTHTLPVLPGASGDLWLDGMGRFHRELLVVQIDRQGERVIRE